MIFFSDWAGNEYGLIFQQGRFKEPQKFFVKLRGMLEKIKSEGRKYMSDANEIYQAVLEKCTAQIELIKKEYGKQLSALLIEQISDIYEGRITSIENDNKKLREEILTLKMQVNSMAKGNTSSSTPSQNSSNNNGKINLNEINRYSCFEFAGGYIMQMIKWEVSFIV